MVLGNPKIRIFGRLREGEIHNIANEEVEEDQIIN